MRNRKRPNISPVIMTAGIIIAVGIITLSSCIVVIGDGVLVPVLGPEIRKWDLADAPLPTGLWLMGSTYNDGYLYIAGGDDSDGSGGDEVNDVYYVDVDSSGELGPSWTPAGDTLPSARSRLTAAALDDKLYVFGGNDGLGPASTVNWANINSDGTIDDFNADLAKNLSTETQGHATVVYNGYIYVIGGESDSGNESRIEYASKSLDWAGTTGLAGKDGQGMAAVAHDGYLYVFGGGNRKTKYIGINGDGTLEPTWHLGPDLLFDRTFAAAVVYNGYVYLVGGLDGIDPKATVYYAKIKDSGNLGDWKLTEPLANAVYGHTAEMVGGRIYVIGGYSGGPLDIVQVSTFDEQ